MYPFHFKALAPILKDALKAKRLTYRDLAAHLKMSEANVKKMMVSDDCSLNRLNDICSLLGWSLADLIGAASDRPVTRLRFTPMQEKILTEDERYLLFYFKVIFEKQTLEKARTDLELPRAACLKLLHRLQKAGLVGNERNGRVQSPHRFPFVWEDHGPVAHLVKTEWSRTLLEFAIGQTSRSRENFSLRQFHLTERSSREMGSRLADLLDEFELRSAAEGRVGKVVGPLSCLFCLVPQSLSALRTQVKQRRAAPQKW